MSSRSFRARFATIMAPRLHMACLAVCTFVATASSPAFAQEGDATTLEDILRRAVATDPRLNVARAGRDAAEAGRVQARARLNPSLEIEAENFGGQGVARSYDIAETTLRLSQTIETGGRRGARVSVAEAEIRTAMLDAEIAALDVFAEVQRAYFAAAAADAYVEIAQERAANTEDLKKAVDRRVAAARDPLMAGARAAAGLADAKLAVLRAQQEAATAKANLASLTGAVVPVADLSPIPHAHSGDAPDIERAKFAVERAGAAARLERARGFNDPTLSVGVRRFEATSDTGLVAGFSVPLGVFDRNAGGIAKAAAEQRKAAAQSAAETRRIEREQLALERQLITLRLSVETIERDIIPEAERALRLARQGYAQGGFSYLDVFEAQRALSAARLERINALLSFHNADAALDRLTGRFSDLAEEAVR